MNTTPHPQLPQKPVCGTLSALSPLIAGVGFFLIIHLFPADPAGFGGAFIAIGFVFVAFLFGAVMGVTSLIRRERLKPMGIFALVINSLPLLVCISFLLRRI